MTNYKPGDKVHPKPEMTGTVIEVEHQENNCSIVCVDWGNDNISWAAPDWLTPAEQNEQFTQLIAAAREAMDFLNHQFWGTEEEARRRIANNLSCELRPFEK